MVRPPGARRTLKWVYIMLALAAIVYALAWLILVRGV
jgi:hypothetical protein